MTSTSLHFPPDTPPFEVVHWDPSRVSGKLPGFLGDPACGGERERGWWHGWRQLNQTSRRCRVTCQACLAVPWPVVFDPDRHRPAEPCDWCEEVDGHAFDCPEQ